MTAVTIAALVVIPAGIALLVWLWVRAGRNYAEVRNNARPQMWLEKQSQKFADWGRDIDGGAFDEFADYLQDVREQMRPRLWEAPDPAEVNEYIERGNEHVRRAMEED